MAQDNKHMKQPSSGTKSTRVRFEKEIGEWPPNSTAYARRVLSNTRRLFLLLEDSAPGTNSRPTCLLHNVDERFAKPSTASLDCLLGREEIGADGHRKVHSDPAPRFQPLETVIFMASENDGGKILSDGVNVKGLSALMSLPVRKV